MGAAYDIHGELGPGLVVGVGLLSHHLTNELLRPQIGPIAVQALVVWVATTMYYGPARSRLQDWGGGRTRPSPPPVDNVKVAMTGMNWVAATPHRA